MTTRPMKVGILGAGKVTPMYLPNLVASEKVELVAVGDVSLEAAEQLAIKYDIPQFMSIDSFVDSDIELVLNLTPMSVHYETNMRMLRAGKHVYSEKPLGGTTRESAEVIALAAELGLILACAPDTLLGPGFQAGRRALDEGIIGKPISAVASMLRPLAKKEVHREGTFPIYDMAPYYISALVHLFGPARSMTSISQLGAEHPAVYAFGSIVFADDVLASVTVRYGGDLLGETSVLHVYGTSGVLEMPNPDVFLEAARWRSYGDTEWQVVPTDTEAPGGRVNLRGIGIDDMIDALRAGQQPSAPADVAMHVVEIIESLCRGDSGGEGRPHPLQTTCNHPAPVALRTGSDT